MNMKYIKSGLLVIAMMSLMGCTDYYERMNTSPNSPSPEVVDPKYQLTHSISASLFDGTEYQVQEQLTICHFVEYIANDILSASRYNIENRYINDLWTKSYNRLANLNNIIETHGDNELYTNVVQMATIWKVWMMLRLTDYLGDIPYSEAGQGYAAPYDTQKDIYYLMFEQLKTAITKFNDNQRNPGVNDLVYNGDNASWIRFANSLRLRMAIRISDVDPTKAQTEAEDAIAKGVITSSDQGAFVARGSTKGMHPLNTLSGFSGFNMSTAFYRIVEGIGGQAWPADVAAVEHPALVDPRAPKMFDPSSEAMGAEPEYAGRWIGTDPGLIGAGAGAALPGGEKSGNVARFGRAIYGSPSRPYPILKYSEVCFLQAQGALKGWNMSNATGTTAKQFYEAGVRDNMNEWGVTNVDAYLTSTSQNFYGTTANYDFNSGRNDTPLDKIMTQKYLSHYLEGSWEAWADHRRTHKPTLMVFANVDESVFNLTQAARDNNTPAAYIKRGYYPSQEYNNNYTNVTAAVARMGGSDNVQTNLWWDVD